MANGVWKDFEDHKYLGGHSVEEFVFKDGIRLDYQRR